MGKVISLDPKVLSLRGHKLTVTAAFLTVILAVPLFAQWQSDSQLTFADLTSWTSINNAWCIAADGDMTHVVWSDERWDFFDIYYKRSSDAGITWSPDTRLTNHPEQYGADPSIGVSGSTVHIVWRDRRDYNDEIYYKRSIDNGLTWGPDIRLTQDDSASSNPSMAVSASNIHVVWHDSRDDTTCEIYYKRSQDNGETWGPDVRLTANSARSKVPSVAVVGSNIHVVWSDNRDGNDEIYYKCSTDNGTTWGPDTRMTNNAPAGSDFNCIAVANTDVHIVWRDYRDGNYEIYHKRSTDNGVSWESDQRLTNNTAYSMYPSVTASGNNVHVVWNDSRNVNMEIYYKLSTDRGATWGTDTRLTNAPRMSQKASIAATGLRVSMVWDDNRWDPANYEIYYKGNPTGNPIGLEEKLTSRCQPFPRVLRAAPNPFVSFATIPGHENERFALYDIAGQRVGIFRGDRIGEGLSAGIYIVKPESGDNQTACIIKVR